MVELPRNASYSYFIPDVRCSKSARSHSTQVVPKLSYNSAFAQARRLHSCGHTARCATINTYVRRDHLSRANLTNYNQDQYGDNASEHRLRRNSLAHERTLMLRYSDCKLWRLGSASGG